MNGDQVYLAFNRGVVSRYALARLDLKRLAFSAEIQRNWMPRAAGEMTLRPGLQYLGTTATAPVAATVGETYPGARGCDAVVQPFGPPATGGEGPPPPPPPNDVYMTVEQYKLLSVGPQAQHTGPQPLTAIPDPQCGIDFAHPANSELWGVFERVIILASNYGAAHNAVFDKYGITEGTFTGDQSGKTQTVQLRRDMRLGDEGWIGVESHDFQASVAGGACFSGFYFPADWTADYLWYANDLPGFITGYLNPLFSTFWQGEYGYAYYKTVIKYDADMNVLSDTFAWTTKADFDANQPVKVTYA